MEEPSITWRKSHFPSAAPAVARRAHQELQELDTVADGPGWRAAAAAGWRNVLCAQVAFLGLGGNLLLPAGLGRLVGTLPSLCLASAGLDKTIFNC